MNRILTIVIGTVLLTVAVPASTLGSQSIETLRNPSVEGPTGARLVTGWNLASEREAQGNTDGETTSDDARTGLQSINLAPEGATGFPGDRLGRLRMMTHVPHGVGAFAPGTDATDPKLAFGTVAAVPFTAVDGITVHYNVSNPLPSDRTISLQVFLYLHEDSPVVTHAQGFNESIDHRGAPDDYLCPIATQQISLSQTDGWAAASWDRSSEFRMTGGVCSNTVDGSVGTLADLQQNQTYQDARVLYLYVQTVANSDDPWPADTPVLVDDMSVTAELPSAG